MKEKAVIVLIGPPGVGKGTLARKCKEDIGLLTISTGEMFREHVERETEIGLKVKDVLNSGGLVSDKLVNKMFQSWFEEKKKDVSVGVLLDGYPRTAEQAEFLSKQVDSIQGFNLMVCLLEASDEQILQRISGRVLCSKASCGAIYSVSDTAGQEDCEKCSSPLIKRGDDTSDCAVKRLEKYIEQRDAIIKHFDVAGVEVKRLETSSRNKAEVFDEFKKMFEQELSVVEKSSSQGLKTL